ncbi:MAG: glycosyltransferase family 4 protein [Bacteroidetes bacterium]|nr:glycosyltransferase family 4 protein [Bacteroidota bacterium]
MNIGLDAKRAFVNQSGLGNYARTLINGLVRFFPENNYHLFTTEEKNDLFPKQTTTKRNISIHTPSGFINRHIKSIWRSYGITPIITKENINIYHGLSNELPFNISQFKGKKIVTIHDLIFLRYPQLYPAIDRKIYDIKFRSACKQADVIVSISEQTKQDIQYYYSIPSEKIKVIYQSCDDLFYNIQTADQIEVVKKKHNLPENYLLYVGTIEERKNILTIIKSLEQINDMPLVVVGKKKAYFKKVQEYIIEKRLEKKIIFLKNVSNQDLPTIFSNAALFIYPSIFEGFGIPILEAITSKVPVITSKGSCFTEAGGPSTIYVNPTNEEELTHEIKKIIHSTGLIEKMKSEGYEYSKKFLPEIISNQVLNLYAS